MKLPDVDVLHVGLGERRVGRIAAADGRVYFEYDADFRLEISPFMLPTGPGLREDKKRTFDGLFGVFHDSLPDGWGRLVLDRHVERLGVHRESLTVLHRLAYVGTRGMGALTYRPEIRATLAKSVDADLDLQKLSAAATALLEGAAGDVLPELLRLAGSSGGARPKIVVGFRSSDGSIVAGDIERPGFVPFLVKFRNQEDRKDAGLLELAYSRMAAAAGVVVAESRVFQAGRAGAFFGSRRFDRGVFGERVHVHSFSGLVHVDHRVPGAVDYDDLMKLTFALTKDHRQVERAFRQMTFNVFAHNRDDHTKNFAFVMRSDGAWELSPAYDLTFSSGPTGEHWLAVAGEGRRPTAEHVLAVARRAGIKDKRAQEIVDEVRAAVARFKRVAADAGVSKATSSLVAAAIVGTIMR